MTVSTWLNDRGLLEKVGGISKLTQLVNRTVSAVNIDRYGSLVMDKYLRRRLIAVSHQISEIGYDTSVELPIVLEMAEKILFEVTNHQTEQLTATRSLGEWLIDSFNALEQQSNLGLSTGLIDLDKLISLQKQDLIVIAARASMGKTWMGCYLADYFARVHQQPVIFFSAEMSGILLTHRFEALESGVDLARLVKQQFNQEEVEVYVKAVETLSELIGQTLFINDTSASGLTPARIRSELRRVQMRLRTTENPNPQLGLVVLDYIQKLGNRNTGNRAQEIGAIAGACKDIAKDFNVPFVALAQINRTTELQTNKRPSMAQIKDSGDIEQDADTILLLYRDEYYNRDTPNRGIMEIIVGKNRNGPTGMCKVLFEPSTGRFKNLKQLTQSFG